MYHDIIFIHILISFCIIAKDCKGRMKCQNRSRTQRKWIQVIERVSWFAIAEVFEYRQPAKTINRISQKVDLCAFIVFSGLHVEFQGLQCLAKQPPGVWQTVWQKETHCQHPNTTCNHKGYIVLQVLIFMHNICARQCKYICRCIYSN